MSEPDEENRLIDLCIEFDELTKGREIPWGIMSKQTEFKDVRQSEVTQRPTTELERDGLRFRHLFEESRIDSTMLTDLAHRLYCSTALPSLEEGRAAVDDNITRGLSTNKHALPDTWPGIGRWMVGEDG